MAYIMKGFPKIEGTKDSKKIIGEQTFKAEKNKNKDQLELGLSLDSRGSADPSDTKNRLIVTPDDNVTDNYGNKGLKEGGFISQFEPMQIQRDSVGRSGNTYYSIIKNKNKK